MSSGSAVAGLLPLIAAYGIEGSSPLPDHLDSMAASALVSGAQRERLTGVLSTAVRAGDLHLPAEVEGRLTSVHGEALVGCLRLERRLLEVDDLFREEQVPFVVLKGSATAHLDRDDPSERTWSDVDVLVRSEDLDRAVGVLLEAGGSRTHPEHRPGWDSRFGKSVGIAADAIEVDVHRTLAEGVYGARIPLGRLHSQSVELPLAGRTLRALSGPARVLHLAYHAAVGSQVPSLSNLRDLALHFTSPAVGVSEVVDEAVEWGGEAVLWSAVDLVRSGLRLDLGDWGRWADLHAPSATERRLVLRMQQGDAGLAKARMDLLRELGWRSRAAYLRGLAMPLATPASALDRVRRWVPALFGRPTG